MLASLAYLKANIEGGEKYNWFYADSTNLGPGTDPLGSGLTVSRPGGDRAAQTRTPYAAGQQLLAPKMLRWWWNSAHQAVYDAGDGQGWVPRGAPSKWVPQSRSITFTEYGFPTCDRCTNQPNVFYDPKSTESFTPYWSAWDPAAGGRLAPRRDDTLAALGLQAVYEYWVVDGKNAASPAGLKMVEPAFMAAWNWDARPFPIFPLLGSVWGDAANWRVGNWLGGKGPALPHRPPTRRPRRGGPYPSFPTLAGRGWSTRYRPAFATAVAGHVSGRESRATRRSQPTWEIEMTFDVLRMDVAADLQALVGFFGACADARGRSPCRCRPISAWARRCSAALPRTPSRPSSSWRGCGSCARSSSSACRPDAPDLPEPARHRLAGDQAAGHRDRVAAHASGREVRSPLYPAALYEFTLPVEGLTPDATHPGLGAASLQALLGLYVQCRGTWGPSCSPTRPTAP